MYRILNKQILSQAVKRLDVSAPEIAGKIQPGQFVMVIAREKGEWIPMAVAEADANRGSVSFVFEEKGPATEFLGGMSIGDELSAVIGPLGQEIPILKTGTVICAAAGVGVAQILPLCRALKKAGNKVIGVIGASSRKVVTLEPQMRLACTKIFITTEDGSYERRGTLVEAVRQVLVSEDARTVYAVGGAGALQSIREEVAGKGVRLWVMLNPVMGCGLGFCGSCRVRVKGTTVLACEKGPVFDAKDIDFEDLRLRERAYPSKEKNQQEPVDEVARSIAKFFPGMLGK